MKTFIFLACLACCLAVQPTQARGHDRSLQAEVLNADAEYRLAVLNGDANSLAAIFADDILIVHSDGTTDSKANFLEAVSSGRLKLTTYDTHPSRCSHLWPGRDALVANGQDIPL